MKLFGWLSGGNSSLSKEEEQVRIVCERGRQLLKQGEANVEKHEWQSATRFFQEALRSIAEINTIMLPSPAISKATQKGIKSLKSAVIDLFTRYHDKGVDARQLRELEKAGNYFGLAVSLQAGTFLATFKLAEVLLHMKDYKRSRELLEGILSSDPNNAKAFRELGWVQIRQDDYTSGIKSLKKAVELDPGDGTAHFFLTICYMAVNDDGNGKIHAGKARSLGVEKMYEGIFEKSLRELGL